MPMTYTLAFSVYKQGIKDNDGLAMVAEVHLGIIGGPAAGLAIEGIRIKQHPIKGLQVVLPPGMKFFGEADEDEILRCFVGAFEQAVDPKKKPAFDDFTGIPEPQVGKFIH